MKDTSSYGIQITGINRRYYRDTIRIYRDAVKYLVFVCLKHYREYSPMSGHEAQLFITHLVHGGKKRKARYPEFDQKFPKFPSELRKAAITCAMGRVNSYRSLLTEWEEGGRQGRQPVLNHNQNVMPCLFNRDMFKRTGDYTCEIKLLHKNDWKWFPLKLNKSDVQYVRKNCADLKESAPVLEQRMHKMYLRFTYEGYFNLPDIEDCHSDQKKSGKYVIPKTICAVDLGVNTDATCCIMHRDGTVTARRFINSPVEKDRLYRILNEIRSSQQDGNTRHRRLWRFVDNYNSEISKHTATEIVRFAKSNGAAVIVMENLKITGKIRGSKKQRLHLWRKREILERVEALAHKAGMRVRTVCAWNTSRLAFDGSGRVKRGKESLWTSGNYSICEFGNAPEGASHGKIYNCDLNGAYNIGARYFTRVILKSIPATEWCALQAKVPDAFRRTPEGETPPALPTPSSVSVTLSTLISLHGVLAPSGAGSLSCAVSVEEKSAAA